MEGNNNRTEVPVPGQIPNRQAPPEVAPKPTQCYSVDEWFQVMRCFQELAERCSGTNGENWTHGDWEKWLEQSGLGTLIPTFDNLMKASAEAIRQQTERQSKKPLDAHKPGWADDKAVTIAKDIVSLTEQINKLVEDGKVDALLEEKDSYRYHDEKTDEEQREPTEEEKEFKRLNYQLKKAQAAYEAVARITRGRYY